MELHLTPELVQTPTASDACESYLARLPLSDAARRELSSRLQRREQSDARTAMSQLHHALGGTDMPIDNPAYGSIDRRLNLAYGAPQTSDGPVLRHDVHGRQRLTTTPPLNRTSMVPNAWRARWRRFIGHPPADSGIQRADVQGPPRDDYRRWQSIGTFRRLVLLGLVIAQTLLASNFMAAVLPYHGANPLEFATLMLFALLFFWISAGFWTAMAGFLLLLIGGDRFAISRSNDKDAPIDVTARTAVVMPIANENVERVFAGLRATYESVQRTGHLERFDFFVLSDSGDPDTRVGEVAAWLALCRTLNGFGRIFYRWRQHRIKRKSGNIADFCRRWGSNYRYMVVLDADSVMSGECLTALVRIAEANPDAGIIQTAPRAAGRDTLYARVQQFATRVYGPLFTAGLHFWQLGESHYWGHNAIIRVAPFMRYCALGRLPGRGSLSGEILSHDFVEAALMRRAGWAVWIAYDLPGSYEEMPPNLIDELKRDRRWCQGNLMNFRLFMMQGLHPAHRAVFMTGVMAYLSAPLWFLFLILSTALLAIHTLSVPQYFTEPRQLFPLWPEWHPEWAVALFGATATLLFLPKILSVLLIWARGSRRFGGRLALAASMLGEVLISALLAPIRMLFHTQFVLAALIGWSVQWKSPPREDTETTWGEAIRRHGVGSLLGVAWAGGVYWLNATFLWWILPVVGALMLSIPLSVYSSRVTLGRHLREARFFTIPEELDPPTEIRCTAQYLRQASTPPGFIDAVMDPVTNAQVCALGIARVGQSASTRGELARLAQSALEGGALSLTAAQRSRLLSDPVALSQLHFQAWTAPEAHASWIDARKRPSIPREADTADEAVAILHEPVLH